MYRIRSRRQNVEHLHQCIIFDWALRKRKQYPMLDFMSASQSGHKRNVVDASMAKRSGLKAGIPDIFLPYPSKGYHGLFIELKRPEKSKAKISEAQKITIDYLNNHGYLAVVCYGSDEAIEAIKNYLNME